MSLYLETEGTVDLPFDAEETAALVTDAALEYIGCPYEAEVDLLLTHDEEIREMNREHRNIDRPTDVLSFPMLEYETPGDFSGFEDMPDYFEFLIAHSMLHLFGFDHMEEDERAVMEQKQREIMEKIQILRQEAGTDI